MNRSISVSVIILAILLMPLTSKAMEKPEIFVQLGHFKNIRAVAFSADGKYVLSGSADSSIKLWEISTGREIRTFIGHRNEVNSVAFSPDGKHILSGGSDRTLRIWDMTTGKEIQNLIGHTDTVNSVAFSPDGKYVLSGSADLSLRLWDVSSAKEIRTFGGWHSYGVNAVAFSPDGKYALSGGGDNIVKLYDIATGKEMRTFSGYFSGHSKRIRSVAFSPDGQRILSGSEDGALKLWDVSTGSNIRTFKGYSIEGHSYGVTSAAFSPDGEYVLAGTALILKLWEAATGKEIRIFEGHDYINAAAFSRDGRHVVSGGDDKMLTLWDVSTGKEVRTFTGDLRFIHSAAFSADGGYALTGSLYDKKLRLWEIRSGQETKSFMELSPTARQMIFLPDNKHVLLANLSHDIKLLDVAAGKEIKTLKGHTNDITALSLSPDGKHALSGSWDNTVRLWNIPTGREIGNFSGHSVSVESVAFSPDGEYFLSSGTTDNSIKLRNVRTGAEIKTLWGHLERVGSLSFSSDGRSILSGSGDKTIKLWDRSTGRAITTFTGHTAGVSCVKFSPDGKTILSGSGDKTLKLWNIATGNEIITLTGHSGRIAYISFSPDGKYALSGSDDGTIKYWDIPARKEVAAFISFKNGEWVVITPEGYFNASPNGAKHLNVRVGNNVYSIDNFYEKFFNPAYIASVLQSKDVQALADIRKGILTPPDVKIISPEQDSTFRADTVTITLSAKDTGGGIDEIRLYHNGKAIGEDRRGLKLVGKAGETIRNYNVTLVDGRNIFRAVGFSKDRTESNPYELAVQLIAPSKEASLYVFAVGINKYRNPALNLNYAVPDAKGIVSFFKDKGQLFKEVNIIEIYDENATKDDIIAKLKLLQRAYSQDAVLIYFAGHGENLKDVWYFIPYELAYPEREEQVRTMGLSSLELVGYIKNIKAQKILMLVDACKSGAALLAFRGFEDRKAITQLSRSTGIHVVAASTNNQYAAEVKELGHGVFTYTLLEGLKGKAAGASNTVTVRKLMGYVEERLPEVTKKYRQESQYPVVHSKGMDFPLIVVK
jgi:WD40 repeat protein